MPTEQSDAQLLRDIEEHMRKMWDARLLPADCWPVELAQRLTQAVCRPPAAPVPQQDVEKLRAELADEVEAADNWRRLALQFDGHRMQAIGHLKAMLTDPQGSEANALAFIKAPPLHGDAVLAQRIAAIVAAAQPPEVAPVELPEPFTSLVRKKSWSPNCYEASPLSRAKDYGRQWADERINVYTEQQVRELLEAHGISEA